MSKKYPKIQLRRTQLPYTNENISATELDFGEPLYLDQEHYIAIGDTADDKKVNAKRLLKTQPKTLIDNGVYFQATGTVTPTATLINDKYGVLQISSGSILRSTGVSVDSELNSLWQTLNQKADLIAPILQKNPATDAFPKAPTPPTNDSTTNIATTEFVTTALNARIESKTQDTTTEKLYVCGVSEANGALKYCGNNAGAQGPGANKAGVYINCKTGALFGSCWNDFAEFRECNEVPGTVVCEVGDGTLVKSSERLQAGASIISDTYGMVIGVTEKQSAPIAVAGRVLAFYSGNKNSYHAGDAVCAAPNGKISVMTREEIKEYPDRIVGYVSEIPAKSTWQGISTENRIWIKVK